jgi:hypothetical protein
MIANWSNGVAMLTFLAACLFRVAQRSFTRGRVERHERRREREARQR